MTATIARIVSYDPFTVEYINGDKRKQIVYEVALLPKEIFSEAQYVEFD